MLDATQADSSQNGLNPALNFGLQPLLTVRQFCESFPWPTESAMRAYVYRAQELGLSDAFVRIRRRVLILPDKFFALIKGGHTNKEEMYEATKRTQSKSH